MYHSSAQTHGCIIKELTVSNDLLALTLLNVQQEFIQYSAFERALGLGLTQLATIPTKTKNEQHQHQHQREYHMNSTTRSLFPRLIHPIAEFTFRLHQIGSLLSRCPILHWRSYACANSTRISGRHHQAQKNKRYFGFLEIDQSTMTRYFYTDRWMALSLIEFPCLHKLKLEMKTINDLALCQFLDTHRDVLQDLDLSIPVALFNNDFTVTLSRLPELLEFSMTGVLLSDPVLQVIASFNSLKKLTLYSGHPVSFKENDAPDFTVTQRGLLQFIDDLSKLTPASRQYVQLKLEEHI
ncbi:hypothetical protein BDC45DRAFT_569532 [Circinella umbellata]|nr:hypothetical protein BDC45DRAFT_569532 [Circinella umbellata]